MPTTSSVEVRDDEGTPLGRVRVGDTKLQALERLGRVGAGGLYDREDVGLLDEDKISPNDGPYVFKPTMNQREKKQRLDDLLFYHRAVLETGSSKSVKLLRVRQFPGGSKRCFLCGNCGTNENKIEASHVLQKQDIYATAGDQGLETLDILKGWTEGRGWRRPFKIHDAMNLVWLCHTHSLAFDSHQFGLCLGGLDNSIRFCSFSDEYNDIVQSANERLQDTSQPFFDMSYVSRRAVGMRLYKAQQSGHYFNHNDPDAWQTMVRLSNAASIDEGEDDTEG